MSGTTVTQRTRFRRWVDAVLHRGPGYDVTTETIADAVAAELHRRIQRLEGPNLPEMAQVQVSGEVIGLQGALGVVLGDRVHGGTADKVAHAYYRAWLHRTGQVRQLPVVREQRERPTHPDGRPYWYHELEEEGWGHCDGCGLWSTATVEQPHQCTGDARVVALHPLSEEVVDGIVREVDLGRRDGR